MVNVFLIIVVVAIAVLLAFGMCLVVVVFGHEDDKNTAWFPKIVTVFGLWLAFASVLVLPYDVANTQAGGDTGVRIDLIWQILYIVLAVMIAFIIPFAFFFYENGQCKSGQGQQPRLNASFIRISAHSLVPTLCPALVCSFRR